MISGSIVAIVTPFQDGKVDEKTLRELVEWARRSMTGGETRSTNDDRPARCPIVIVMSLDAFSLGEKLLVDRP